MHFKNCPKFTMIVWNNFIFTFLWYNLKLKFQFIFRFQRWIIPFSGKTKWCEWMKCTRMYCVYKKVVIFLLSSLELAIIPVGYCWIKNEHLEGDCFFILLFWQNFHWKSCSNGLLLVWIWMAELIYWIAKVFHSDNAKCA